MVRPDSGRAATGVAVGDYFACSEHVNCVPDLAAFRAQAPMRELLFAGEHKLRRYIRFMLIGRK
jgi:hypothetical protein